MFNYHPHGAPPDWCDCSEHTRRVISADTELGRIMTTTVDEGGRMFDVVQHGALSEWESDDRVWARGKVPRDCRISGRDMLIDLLAITPVWDTPEDAFLYALKSPPDVTGGVRVSLHVQVLINRVMTLWLVNAQTGPDTTGLQGYLT